MIYLMPENAVEALRQLRKDYIKQKGIDPAQPQPWLARPTSLGGVDHKAKNEQILLIERLLCMLEKDLNGGYADPNTREQHYKAACRILLAGVMYLREQIAADYAAKHLHSPHNSVLYHLISEAMGINGTNRPDEEDQKIAFATALVAFQSPGALTRANAQLAAAKYPEFDADQYLKFLDFLQNRSRNTPEVSEWVRWPASTLGKEVGSLAGETIGLTGGFLSGQVVSTSLPFMTTQRSLAHLMVKGVVLAGLSGTGGMLFVAPAVASKLLEVFCQVLFAMSMRRACKKGGEYAGMAIGIPLDLAWKGAHTIGTQIYHWQKGATPGLSGYRLADGKHVVKGVVMDSQIRQEENTQTKTLLVEETEDAYLVAGEAIQKDELMDAVIAELQKRQLDFGIKPPKGETRACASQSCA